MTVHGSCLCEDVAWEADGPFELMHHCHCARCRKAHGTPFGTSVACPADNFRLARGRERIARYESAPGIFRCFCKRCGGVVPDGTAWEGRTWMPAGPLDDDPGDRSGAHIFVGSNASWLEIHDALPRFDAFPPGFDLTVLDDPPPRDPATGAPRGSCVCGGVAFVVQGRITRWNQCHCSRCRKARGAAYASNVLTAADGVRFTRGEDLLASYKVPEARYFMQVFCRRCGSPMPRIDRERDLAVVPVGALDDDPGIRPQRHIFVASKAPWDEIADDLPQHEEAAPPG